MTRTIEILLAEDDPADADLARENLERATLRNNLHVVPDGIEAMRFLRREGAYAAAPRPDLMLLDLNMPRKDGREVLTEMKADPNLRRIPVAVFTSSDADEDVTRSYDLHANCYITKPVDLVRFEQIVKTIEEFWFSVVTLPPS